MGVGFPHNVGRYPSGGSLFASTCCWIFHRADDRKRYTAAITRQRAVQQNPPWFLAPIRDADRSTQPRTGFGHQLLAVHRTAAFQVGRRRFLT